MGPLILSASVDILLTNQNAARMVFDNILRS